MKYYIDGKKYRVKPEEAYIRVNGWCFDEEGLDYELKAMVDGKRCEIVQKQIARSDVQKKYGKKCKVTGQCGFSVKVFLEDKDKNPESFVLYAESRKEKQILLQMNGKSLMKNYDDSTISYSIDWINLEKEKMVVSGWATSIYGVDTIKLNVAEKGGSDIPEIKTKRNARKDIIDAGLAKEEDINCGFILEFPYRIDKEYEFTIADRKRCKHITINPVQVKKHNSVASKVGFTRQFVKCLNMKNIKKGIGYISKNGFKGLKEYVVTRVNSQGMPYNEWFELHKPSKEELEKERKVEFDYAPKISIIVPTYKTPINFLRDMIDSVIDQTYSNWELCIADGSEGDMAVEAELKRYSEQDSRIRYRLLEKNEGISGNTNAALEMTEGEYVGLFDHDDILAPNALYEVVNALQEKKYDILYTDEDKITGDGKEHNDPNFKPDFSMDLFRSDNYITHFFVVKTEIIKGIGGFRAEYDGSQDYDLMFRCIENSENIKHIPMILYHWRIHMNSVAGDPSSKMYAYEAGKKAIEDHLKRMGIKATVEHVGLWGMYHVIYDTPGDPLISIVIPNKDHVDDLDKCIQSILTKSIYKNYEFVIVENNSEEQKTFEYYEKIQKKHDNITVVTWEKGFNYSAINNYGVQFTKGDYLLFLNNDTEMITETALSELLGCCMREDVGAVGAKLLYSDDTVQHAGVVIGFGGYAGHVNMGIKRDDYGYMVRARINCNYSAVTAACMMTKKSLFEQVGGFDEQFVVACNDVDYCLKIRELDKWVIYNAFSEWYHYESKSRGYEDTPEKLKRFEGEVEKFQKKWPEILEKGDPFYNPNFPINRAPFTWG